ncbi:MAG: hypothetical protein K2G02_02655 [Phocaeicola sp.]|uniref:DUF5018-related domain-containing protein n=1 Tax=Phocaeicola sp. TaxID=2773926 RepID=UPI0023C57922|nr:hypothetical protein [Phocaeicola sp.]MDE5677592.1 hypothetical protein [Phocaeicola sp.]MDE6180027.1 hypothetical protein [Phocaeicola sp.]
MKALYKLTLLALLAILSTSCLKSGLDELETYNQNDITNIRFEYRWWEESAQRLRVIEMEVTKTIDKEAKEITCSIKVPAANNTFTESIRNQVSLSTLAVNVDVSTAARVTPVGNAPAMGTFPSDFSAKEFTYNVMAGSGDKVNWTIKITDFTK